MPHWLALTLAAFVGFGIGVGLVFAVLTVKWLHILAGQDEGPHRHDDDAL